MRRCTDLVPSVDWSSVTRPDMKKMVLKISLTSFGSVTHMAGATISATLRLAPKHVRLCCKPSHAVLNTSMDPFIWHSRNRLVFKVMTARRGCVICNWKYQVKTFAADRKPMRITCTSNCRLSQLWRYLVMTVIIRLLGIATTEQLNI